MKEKRVLNRCVILHSPIFSYFYKHKCPNCGAILSVKWAETVFHSKSEEAKKYNLADMDGSSPIGWVKVKENQFLCANCKNTYSVSEIRSAEKTGNVPDLSADQDQSGDG